MKFKKAKLSLITVMTIGAIALTGCGGSSDDSSDSEETVTISSPEAFESIPGTTASLTVSNTDTFALTPEAATTAKNLRLYFDDADMAEFFTVHYESCDALEAGKDCRITVTQTADKLEEGSQISGYIQGDNTVKYPIVITVERLDIVDTGGIKAISPGEDAYFDIGNPTDYAISGLNFATTTEGVSLSDDCEGGISAQGSCRLTVAVPATATTSDLDLEIAGEQYNITTDGENLVIVRPELSFSTNYTDLDNPSDQYNVVEPGQSLTVTIYNRTAARAKGLNLTATTLNDIVGGLTAISNGCASTLSANSQCTIKFEAAAGSVDDRQTWTIPAGSNFDAISTDMAIVGQADLLNLSSDADSVITSSNTPAEVSFNLANSTGYEITQLAIKNIDSHFTLDAAKSSCDDSATLAVNGQCTYVFSYNPGEVGDYFTKAYTFEVEGAANNVNVVATAAIDTINLKLFYTVPFDTLLSGNQLPSEQTTFVTTATVDGQKQLIVGSDAGIAISKDGGILWRYITAGQGLASNDIYDESYAVDGNMLYVGTNDAGLSAIDLASGEVVKNYSMGDGLVSYKIKSLAISDGKLYVGSDSGVSVLDLASGQVDKTYTSSDGLGNNSIYALVVDGNKLYVGMQNGYVSVIDLTKEEVVKSYNDSNGLVGDDGYGLALKDNTLYYGSFSGISVLDLTTDQVSKTYTTSDGLIDNNVYTLKLVDNTLYIGTDSGISLLDVDSGQVIKNYDEGDGMADDRTINMSIDGDLLYAATRYGSLSTIDVLNDSVSVTPAYFAGAQINSVVDYQGMLYAANRWGGIHVFDATNHTYQGSVTVDNGLPSNLIYSLLLDGSTLYIGTYAGLTVYDLDSKQVTKTYTTADGLIDNRTYDILKDGQSLYLATYGGGVAVIDLADETVSRIYSEADGLGSKYVNALALDNGMLYAGSYSGGVSVIDLANETVSNPYTEATGLGSNNVYSLAFNGEIFYVGTDDGISVIDLTHGEVEKTYTTGDGLGSNSIYSLSADGSTLYLGTSRGLSSLDLLSGGVDKTYTTADGLASNYIPSSGKLSIIDGKLYVPTLGGLSVVPVDSLD